MNREAEDLLTEAKSIEALLRGMPDKAFTEPTGFKDWTTEMILRHLAMGNQGAVLSLTAPEKFEAMFKEMRAGREKGRLIEVENKYVGDVHGQGLVDAWMKTIDDMMDHFADADLSQRVPWGPRLMSARSSISARIMENWAHAQAIYDLMGVERENGDQIHHIAVLGANTYGWTFKNRGMEPPGPRPVLELTAPSGAAWTFPSEGSNEAIRGDAVEFCQVVTQTRNVADTNLEITGRNGRAWMDIAQCFAGPPNDPPPPGARAPNPSPPKAKA